MKINRLNINNFRCIHELDIDFHEQMNIFVGVNGAGKSSILDCLAVLLSRFIGRIKSYRETGRFFTKNDILTGKAESKNIIKISFQDEILEWQVTKARFKNKGQKITNLEQIKKFTELFRNKLEIAEDINIPLAVYYSTNRAVLDIPLRIRKKHTFEQLSAYDQALSGGRNDFRLFFEWFRSREDLENEKRGRNNKYRDRQLEAVRKAIINFLPKYNDLRVQRSPLRMTVSRGEHELTVNQLSDGEKCLFAMVGDLARRLAIANPKVEQPLNGEGVVLIDEIDLHLHPSWQRRVVHLLKKTFPKCQFVLTTHSAQILSHVRNAESVFLLKYRDDKIQITHPESVFGLDSNRILEDLMEVTERPEEIKISIDKLFDSIDQKKLKEARIQLNELKKDIKADPQLVKADVLIRRMEIIGK